MGDNDTDAFYVVRKGDLIGIYKSLRDCQMLNPTVTVYKGCGLPKEAEEYLIANGLKNSSLTVSASQVKEGLLGSLMVCPFQQPCSSNAQVLQRGSNFQQSQSQISIGKEKVDKGSILWEHNVGDPITAAAYIDEHIELLHTSALPGDRLMCVCTSGGRICVFKKSMVTVANEHLGKRDVEKFAEILLEGDIFSSPVMIGGRIFVGCRDDYLHCITAGINVSS